MSDGDQRIAERVPASLRVRLKYSDESAFIEKYAVNISRGGIFIATRSPKPVGTTLRFDMLLESGDPVVRGEGAVVWVKPYDAEHPERAHGMGVRFTWLDEASRMVIDRALAWKEEARRRHDEEEAREELEPPPTAPDPTRRVDLAEFMRQNGQAPAQPAAKSEAPTPEATTMEAALQTAASQPIVIELEADEPTDEELELEVEVVMEPEAVPEPLVARVDTAPIGTREPPAPALAAGPLGEAALAIEPFEEAALASPGAAPATTDEALAALLVEAGLDDERIATTVARAHAEATPLLAHLDDSADPAAALAEVLDRLLAEAPTRAAVPAPPSHDAAR